MWSCVRMTSSCAAPAAWALLSLLLAAAAAVSATRACNESGYCSVGVSEPWGGDIRDSGKFREMLQAVAFKQELIITIYLRDQGAISIWEDQALQLHSELLEMGFAHHLFISLTAKDCQQISWPTLTCVWDSSNFPAWVLRGEEALWHFRWKFVARAARLGYNVMSVDTDTIFFRDPYVHLKSPPFKDFNMMCNPEGGAYNCNGGFVYVQNVRPDGPVTWVFMEVTRNTLRRADDHFNTTFKWTNRTSNCFTFDQAHVQDALSTAAVGRPVPWWATNACKRGGQFVTRSGNTIDTDTVLRNINGLIAGHIRVQVFEHGPNVTWLAKVGFTDVPNCDKSMLAGNLTVPNMNYGWPEELGGRFFPEGPLGELSRPWVQMLKEDCPSCPWWAEERQVAEDRLPASCNHDFTQCSRINTGNANMFIDPTIPQEAYGQLPKWLASSLGSIRRGMFLGPNATRQGYLSVGHVHGWHMQTGRPQKIMVRKVYGHYNWTLGTEVAKVHNRVSPYFYPSKVSRVLALSPKVDLSRTRSWHELSSIITGLVQVAWLSQRVLLMPDLPCQTSWIHHRESLAAASIRKHVCIAPTFWHHPHSYPIPVTVPVDERGELVGGWARRRLAGQSHPAHPRPLLVAPSEGDEGVSRAAEAGAALHGRPRAHRRLVVERQLPRFTSDAWWSEQRYVAVMPQLWDHPCTADLHGIISAEFFHWLKHTPEGQRAKFDPTDANTVLQADASDERLSLKPPLGSGPGSSSSQVPAGDVVPPSNRSGWSWWDVQVALPSLDIVREMQRVADEPLVYVGHPVMVVPSQGGLGAEVSATADERFQRVGAQQTPAARSANRLLEDTIKHLKRIRCKALWEEPETKQGKLVDLHHGLPGRLTFDSAPAKIHTSTQLRLRL